MSTSEVDCRINGVLATTRGLGNHGDPELKKCVLVEPHTCSMQIDQYAQFVVMATSGVWEILSDQEVTNLLMMVSGFFFSFFFFSFLQRFSLFTCGFSRTCCSQPLCYHRMR